MHHDSLSPLIRLNENDEEGQLNSNHGNETLPTLLGSLLLATVLLCCYGVTLQ